jgi:predicted TIM-barrel fold metal-dependent hydrolase
VIAMPHSIVVDADAHVVEPPDLWTSRMDSKWGDWTPRYFAEDPREKGEESWYFGGVRRVGGAGLHIFACSAGMDSEALLRGSPRFTEGHAAGWDPAVRTQVMDDEGIDACVLFPSLSCFFGPLDPIEALRDAQFTLACQQAYNDWVTDFCAASPKRLFAMGAVPLQDVELAIAETERVVKQLGLLGVWIRPAPYLDGLPFSHPSYDRFWATCQALEIPIAFHPVVHVDFPGAARQFQLVRASPDISEVNQNVDPQFGGAALGQAVGNPVDMMVTMGRLIMGGVCERFPRLRFLFLESGGGWVANTLERMDEQVKAFPAESRWLSLLPSEYFKRQCFISFEPEESTLGPLAPLIGTDRIVWASDFPHADAPYPGGVDTLSRNIQALPEPAQRQILGENAVSAYGLPIGS